MRGRQTRYGTGEHIALHAQLDDLVPLLAKLQHIHRLARLQRLHAQGGFAHRPANGQRLQPVQRSAQRAGILRLRQIVVPVRNGEIHDVLAEHIAGHAVLFDLGPFALIFNDTDEFICLNAPQLFGGG